MGKVEGGGEETDAPKKLCMKGLGLSLFPPLTPVRFTLF